MTAAHIYPTPEILEQKRHEFGLDQPLLTQYIQTLQRISRLDFGTSYLTNKPVWDEVKVRLPATVELALSSMVLSIVVSIPLGVLAAMRKNGWIDMLSRGISYFGASIPQFWLGYLLIFFFSVRLDWLPVEGRGTWQHLVLPTLTLSLVLIALYTRLLRSSVLEQLQETYVQYARTRGIRERVIMLKHVLKIAIAPLITGMGMNLGKLLTGTIIVEQVFSWPGFGTVILWKRFLTGISPSYNAMCFWRHACSSYAICSLIWCICIWIPEFHRRDEQSSDDKVAYNAQGSKGDRGLLCSAFDSFYDYGAGPVAGSP